MKVTIRDVANAAGVSVGTVSRAFNGYQDINVETKKKVFEAAKQLGYAPNVNARSLSAKVSKNMGLIVSGFLQSDRRDGFVHMLLKGTYRYAFEHYLEVALYTLDSENQSEKTYARFCAEHSIFGAILSGVATTDPYFKELMNAGMPCVLIDVDIQAKGVGSISVDNVKAAMEITEYLLNANHEKIVVVQGKEDAAVNNYRMTGIVETLSKRGIELTSDQILTCNFSETLTYNKVKEYILKNGKESVTAFLCLSDIMALGVMKAVRELGYSIPEDFSVIGFDGIPITAYTTPGLTTIEQDVEEMGYQAGALLQELMKHPNMSKKVYVPYTFKERGSVKKL